MRRSLTKMEIKYLTYVVKRAFEPFATMAKVTIESNDISNLDYIKKYFSYEAWKKNYDK